MFKTTKIIIAIIVAAFVATMVGIVVTASFIASDRTIGMILFFCFPIAMVAAVLGEELVKFLWAKLIPHDYAIGQLLWRLSFAVLSRLLATKFALTKVSKWLGLRSHKGSLYERYLEVKSH